MKPRIRVLLRGLLTVVLALCAQMRALPVLADPEDPTDMAQMMSGLYAPYAMTREASGTSWQPDSTPAEGLMGMRGPWSGMIDGFADLVHDEQGGPRGAVKTFSVSMLMLMARRQLEDAALGLRLMLSGDPLMGRDGYPLLLQTGETANGVTPLVDRQHPHDLLMEAAASYSLEVAPATHCSSMRDFPGSRPSARPPSCTAPRAWMTRRRRSRTTGSIPRTSRSA